MYQLLLGLHNILRWVVVLGGLYAIIVSLQGLFTKAQWTDTHKRAGLIFTSAFGLQLIVGIVLYVISPLIKVALSDMSAAMKSDQLRFFSVEHFTVMLLALVAAQLGYSLGKRAESDRAKFMRSGIGYVVAGLLLAYGIPWWRPLFPGL